MAQSDHTECIDNLAVGSIKWVASGAFPTPTGGGTFCFAWKSLDATPGLSTRFFNGVGLAPAPAGGIVQAAMKRGTGSGTTGFAPFICICLGGTSNTDTAYILGLADGDPSHLVLRKGSLVGGLPDVEPGNQGVLWRSTEVFEVGTWVHVRLMAAVNLNGDVVLSVWINNGPSVLEADQNWVQVAGVNLLDVSGSGITDDAAGINTGSPSLTSGNIGWGFWKNNVNRVAYIDHIEAVAQ